MSFVQMPCKNVFCNDTFLSEHSNPQQIFTSNKISQIMSKMSRTTKGQKMIRMAKISLFNPSSSLKTTTHHQNQLPKPPKQCRLIPLQRPPQSFPSVNLHIRCLKSTCFNTPPLFSSFPTAPLALHHTSLGCASQTQLRLTF